MRRLLFLAGVFLAASATAQTVIDITSQQGLCSYPTGAVSSGSTPGHLSATLTGTPAGSGCSTGSSVPAVTFGPAQPLSGPGSTLAAGSNIAGNFSVLPLFAVSCTATIGTTSGTGTVSPTSLNVCGFTGKPSCTATTPIPFSASFTNTGAGASSYQASVNCLAASGASPASTQSNTVTVNQSGNSGGTPAANFTFSTSGLVASFNDTSTDPGGTIGSWSWDFGDTSTSTTPSPSHTYAAAGTYNVTLTVTDSVSSAQSSKTLPVTVPGGGSCPVIGSSTAGITGFSQLTGQQSVNYYGNGVHPRNVASFAEVYGTWPGNYNALASINLPFSNYLSEQFTVPSNYFTAPNVPNPIYGNYTVSETGFTARVSITISTKCGDFSNPATNATSTVVPGCWLNAGASDTFVQWRKPSSISSCALSGGGTYFLNMINADVSNVTPGGGTAASKKNPNCASTTCTVTVANGLGNWSGYTPQ